jgi:hypothetical protein
MAVGGRYMTINGLGANVDTEAFLMISAKAGWATRAAMP